MNEIKLCECGCGQSTGIITKNYPSRGWVKGKYKRFVDGHNCRGGRHNGNGHRIHGLSSAAEYRSYNGAKTRCTNPKQKDWPDYGGRGIEFRFTDFQQFFAELGPRPAGMTLDRINNDGHYEPGNVRWATRSEQNANQRRSVSHASLAV